VGWVSKIKKLESLVVGGSKCWGFRIITTPNLSLTMAVHGKGPKMVNSIVYSQLDI
jgi:hypothetical protein